jgi:hypothetical protein
MITSHDDNDFGPSAPDTSATPQMLANGQRQKWARPGKTGNPATQSGTSLGDPPGGLPWGISLRDSPGGSPWGFPWRIPPVGPPGTRGIPPSESPRGIPHGDPQGNHPGTSPRGGPPEGSPRVDPLGWIPRVDPTGAKFVVIPRGENSGGSNDFQ